MFDLRRLKKIYRLKIYFDFFKFRLRSNFGTCGISLENRITNYAYYYANHANYSGYILFLFHFLLSNGFFSIKTYGNFENCSYS